MDGTGQSDRVIAGFFVQGVPAPQGSKTLVLSRLGKPMMLEGKGTVGREKHKVWRETVSMVAMAHKGRHRLTPYEGPVALIVEFVMPRPKTQPKKHWHDVRPDLSKLIRSTEDSLTGHLYKDDAQIATIAASARYQVGTEPTGAHIQLLAL